MTKQNRSGYLKEEDYVDLDEAFPKTGKLLWDEYHEVDPGMIVDETPVEEQASSKTIVDKKLLWDEFENNSEMIVNRTPRDQDLSKIIVDKELLQEEYDDNPHAIVGEIPIDELDLNIFMNKRQSEEKPTERVTPKQPLYKRVLNKIKNKVSKKTVLGTALAALALAPVDYQQKPRDFSQRQPELEQLLDAEKEILQMPVRVKRELKLKDVELYLPISKVTRGPKGFEINEEDCLFTKFKFEHYGLRNRKLIFKQEFEPLGKGRARTRQNKDSYSKSGPAESGVDIGCNLSPGNYLLKSTIEEPKSGLSAQIKRRLRVNSVRSELNLNLFEFCKNNSDAYCSRTPISVPRGGHINFRYFIGGKMRSKNLNLLSNYRLTGPNGQILISEDKTNLPINRGLFEHKFIHQINNSIITQPIDAPGVYTLDVFVKDLDSNQTVHHTEKFTLY